MDADCILSFEVEAEYVEAGDTSFTAVTISVLANETKLDEDQSLIVPGNAPGILDE